MCAYIYICMLYIYIWVFPKIREKSQNGMVYNEQKPYYNGMIWGNPIIFGNTLMGIVDIYLMINDYPLVN